MKGFFFYAIIICFMILYFYTMVLIHKIVNGNDSKMGAKLISHILGGCILVGIVGVTISFLLF